ncbi:alpha-methylacyl-CoA racemase [Afipia massiliensis]|uniref:Alpha-methylacyl-CoA racemase n=1 Tax=Afipia massiliensis TaxID=211460 RepID=A0A840NBL3_9BRAD|nr:CaiB/BaiF CoA-transferase family protein [Afipia massiliensis]MBB5055148.1 alpha-methylacyl-CoA racemase [Afipia massiliensis]
MGPLAGLRIVELAGIGAGPHCAMMLADMGADVVRVDRLTASGLGVPIDAKFDLLLRGRRSLAVDLKSEAGRDTVLRMIDQADAVIESFRPGVVERMGLGPDVCLSRNPKLVFGRLTGWGQNGPYAQMAGHDINYIALSGVLHAIGSRGGLPVPPLNLVGDFGGGAVYAAFGIVSALLHAQRTGQGQVVDAAMVDGAAALLTMVVGFQRGGIWSSQRGDNIVDGGAPYYAAYETSDGRFVSIGAMEEKFYELLLTKLNLGDDANMRPHTDRSRWEYQRDRFKACFLTRSRDEWCAVLEGTDTCFAPVLTIDEASSHPHLKARKTYVDLNGVNQPAPNPRFSVTPSASSMPPASLGQHSREVLADWGIASEAIEKLCSSSVVFQAN